MNFKLTIVFLCSALIFIQCSKVEDPVDQIRERSGVINFEAGPDFQNKVIPVHYFVPAGGPKGKEIQLVLHGADRNATDYLAGWAQKARIYDVIVLAPEFSSTDFNTTQYNEGNFIVSGQLNLPEKTTFSLMDRIFNQAVDELEAEATKYNIYGHSAGAQFVHRYLQFYNSSLVNKAVAANAGWYTFPDVSVSYPYGIRDLYEDPSHHFVNYHSKNLIVLLGTADTNRDNSLRVTQQADNQGRHRFERGQKFFEFNQNLSLEHDQPFNWSMKFVEDVGHQHREMSAAAADAIYGL